MISNQIAVYNGRFRLPRAWYSLWYSLERCGSYKFEYRYFFTSGMAGHGWNAKTNIECEYKRFFCIVLTTLSAEGVNLNLRESVTDLPRLIELTFGCRNSGADLFVCTKCYERLYNTRFERANRNAEGIKGRSAVFISPLRLLNAMLNDNDQLVVLVENDAHAPNELQQQSEFQLQNL